MFHLLYYRLASQKFKYLPLVSLQNEREIFNVKHSTILKNTKQKKKLPTDQK